MTVTVFACSVSLVVASCGASSDDNGLPNKASKLSLPSDWTQGQGTELPPLTAARTQIEADIQTLENAAGSLASECMAREGFRYEPSQVPIERDRDPYSAPRLDPEQTAIDGYGDLLGGANAEDLESSDSTVDAYVKRLSKEQRAAFEKAYRGTKTQAVEVDGGGYSVPANGCLAEGREAVGGDAFVKWTATEDALANAIALASDDVETSSEYADAQKDWSACMDKVGFHYASDGEAMEDALTTFGSTGRGERPVSEAEKSMATADASCREESGLLDTVIGVQRTNERKAMTTVESTLSSWLESRKAVLGEAEQALRGPGGG
jgi:hypothetical protein